MLAHLAAADELKSPMPIASATRQIIAQAAGAGVGVEEDFATLLLEVARGAGVELKSEDVAAKRKEMLARHRARCLEMWQGFCAPSD